MTHFEILNKLDPAIISHFIETGQSEGIPKDTQQWLQEISMALEIYDKDRNISNAAKELKKRIKAKYKIIRSVRACQERIYAALEYFHVDNTVSDKVWYIDFANKYEDIAKEAREEKDFRSAYLLQKAAEECREKSSIAASINTDFVPVYLISPDISIIDLSFEKKSLKEIAKKNNDGFYIKMINGLPTDEENKKRLRIDANLPETPYEEIETD